MFSFDQYIYAPLHKWKAGELQAYGSLSIERARMLLPLFVVPPTDEWDYDKLQRVTLVEHLKNFGNKLHRFRGNLPALIDANLLDSPEWARDWDTHPLTALLERARQAHALAYPVISPDSSAEYAAAARSFLARHDHIGWALRVRLSQLDHSGWVSSIETAVEGVGQRVGKAAMVLDAGPIDHLDDGLVDVVIDRLNQMPHLRDWGGIYFSATSFPEKRDGAAGTIGTYPRLDKSLFARLYERRNELIRVPNFSDYALEYPSKFKTGGGTPKAHVRYSSNDAYLVAEGESTKGKGFKIIKSVARQLCSHAHFQGASFSEGDAYISKLGTGAVVGNPSKWRWCATDHHLTLVLQEQAELLKVDAGSKPAAVDVDQRFIPGLINAVRG